jgi:hypothetical protein
VDHDSSLHVQDNPSSTRAFCESAAADKHASLHQSILWITTAASLHQRDSTPSFHQAFCDHDNSKLCMAAQGYASYQSILVTTAGACMAAQG